ncbi:MAG: hypothetical protein KatS3mg057_1683 [Herpetosiphonaceae bacterium]|nr:MAG: hypothetical protein KatS3mg057_1683 [Herpetosiphonaceae bacterium]
MLPCVGCAGTPGLPSERRCSSAAWRCLSLSRACGWHRRCDCCCPLLLLGLLMVSMPDLLRIAGELRRRMLRGAAATGLLAAALVIVALLLARLISWSLSLASEGARSRDPVIAALVFLLGYLLALGILSLDTLGAGVRRAQVRLILGGWSIALFSVLVVGWLAYEWSVVRSLPFVGHADYADNAVVARNLLRGRGWVVDYVTQFYKLNPAGSVVRPQETWPLLQPVWILPFFAAFGPQAWAAKLPNLIVNLLLAISIFLAGARLWDRRVGFVAAALTLTNQYFFRLTIFVTSDLAFVLFSFAAILLLFFGHERDNRRLLIWSGLLTGLMCLQKPSGVIVAGGDGALVARATVQPG